jgi:hypothetical protein
VIYNELPGDTPVRLMCIDCLTRDSPPYEPIDVHNSPNHCCECFMRVSRYPGFGKLPHSHWWGS